MYTLRKSLCGGIAAFSVLAGGVSVHAQSSDPDLCALGFCQHLYSEFWATCSAAGYEDGCDQAFKDAYPDCYKVLTAPPPPVEFDPCQPPRLCGEAWRWLCQNAY